MTGAENVMLSPPPHSIFWCAFEDEEMRVIGDEPYNTREDQNPSEKAVS
jgi:hypothetical protein